VLFALASFSMNAETYYFNHIRAKDGLADDKVQAIVRDSEAFVWIGTYRGLSRFDGKRIVNYRHDSDDSLSIPSDNILDLFVASDSSLWVGTQDGGLAYYDRIYDTFVTYNTINSKLPSNTVFAIVEGEDGVLWVGTADGLCYWDPETKEIESAFFLSGNTNVRICNSVKILEFTPDKHVWVGTSSGLFVYSPQEALFKRQLDVYPDMNVLSLKYGHEGLWVGTKENGLLRLSADGGVAEYCFADELVVSNSVGDLQIDNDGALWCAVDFHGVGKYNADTDSFEFVQQNKLNENSLGSRRPYRLYFDSNGVVWIGHSRKGVSFSVLSKSAQIVRTVALEDEQMFDYALSLLFKNDSTLIVGTEGYGLSLCSYSAGENLLEEKVNFLKGTSVHSLCLSPTSDTLWAGTYRNGLAMIDLKRRKVKMYKHSYRKTKGIAGNDVRSIVYSEDKTKLYLAIHGAGMSILNLKTKRFESFLSDKDDNTKIKNKFVYEVLPVKRGRLWLPTAYGLSKMEEPLPLFKTFLHEPHRPENVAKCHFTDVHEDKNGQLWCATENGICLLHQDNWQFEFFAPPGSEGSSTAIYSIQEDAEGNFWLTSSDGLLFFNVEHRIYKRALQSDVVGARDFFRRSSAQNSEGLLLFGSSKGILAVQPSGIFEETEQYALSIVIDELRVHNREVKPHVDTALIDRHINYVDSVTLQSDQNSISISYSAIDFFAPSLHRFRYRLLGFDKEWNYVGSEKRAVYTELPPGQYQFEVEVSRDGQNWTGRDFPLVVTVDSAWWVSWWARSAAVLFVMILVVLVYWLRISKIRADERKMARLVALRTKELEETLKTIEDNNIWIKTQNRTLSFQKDEIISQKEDIKRKNEELEAVNKTKDRFLSIIAHDLKNPLHAILGFSELLIKRKGTLEPKKENLYMEHINTSSVHLLAILENLLQWARSQTDQIQIQPEQLFSDLLIYESIDQLKNYAARKDVVLKVADELSVEFYADKNMMNTILRNLISNAIKYSNSGGTVTVRAKSLENSKLVFSVTDSGVGMSEEKASKLFVLGSKESTPGTNNETGTGLGLIICKEFVEKHKGEIWVESIVGKGTSFYFSIPSLTALNLSVDKIVNHN